MELIYEPVGWKNGEAGGTPVNEDNLNKMEKGITDCVKKINELDNDTTGIVSQAEHYAGNAEVAAGDARGYADSASNYATSAVLARNDAREYADEAKASAESAKKDFSDLSGIVNDSKVECPYSTSLVTNGYQNVGTGDITTDSNWYTSDYIEVYEEDNIEFELSAHSAVGSVCLFDANKNFVKSISHETVDSKNFSETYIVENGIKYARFTMYKKDNPYNLTQYFKLVHFGIAALTKYKADKLYVLNSKNIMKLDGITQKTYTGVTFTPFFDSNGLLQYININGTSTDTTYYTLDFVGSAFTSSKYKFEKETKYIATLDVNGKTNKLSNIILNVGAFNERNDIKPYVNVNTSSEFTTNQENIYSRSYLSIASGVTINNVKVYPMIRLATEPSGFEPYNAGTSLEGKKISNEVITDVWNPKKTYTAGSYVIYNNALWKCLTQNTGVAPVEDSNWTKTSLSNELTPISIPVSSFITLNSGITSASTISHIYKVGNHITGTLHLSFKNAFTGLTVGTIGIGYRPSNPEILTAFSGSNMWSVCNSMYAHLTVDGVLSINNVNGHADQNACMIWLDYFI